MPFGVWVVAGVVVGAVGSGVLVATGALSHDDDAGTDPVVAEVEAQDEAGVQFIDAWERSRFGTFVVESTLERTFPDGSGFTSERSVAQRPPDRLERSLGSITSRLDGQVVLCRTEQQRYRCSSGRAGRSYRALVRDEVEALRSHVEGPVPLYAVAADGACFDLSQVRPLPAPPYGTAARFCFDDETGALTFLRVERDEAVDVTEATSLRAEVRDDDLRPPETGDPSTAAVPERDEE